MTCLRAAPILATIAAAIGAALLVAYLLGVGRHWTVASRFSTHPLSAACLFLLGSAARLSRPRRASRLGLILAILAGIIALIRVACGVTGDPTLFIAITPFRGQLLRAAAAGTMIQMERPAAATFLLLSMALILRHQRRMGAAQCLAGLACAPPFISLVGHVYRVHGSYGTMPAITTLGALAAGLGGLLLTAHRGMLRGLLSPWPAGRLARIQILSLWGACLVGGLAASRLHIWQDPRTMALQTICRAVAIVIVIGTGSHIYEKIDRRRRTAEQAVAQAALIDLLTGLPNRRSFYRAAELLFTARSGVNDAVSIVIVDIDCFKSINDRFGHETGDAVLRRVGEILPRHVQAGDIVGRVGGEEFALILPGAGRLPARDTAEALRAALEASTMDDLATGLQRVTISLGVASGTLSGSNLRDLLADADAALYRAKADGRNRVCLFPDAARPTLGGRVSSPVSPIRAAPLRP